jgi:hypothetical protein
MDIVDRLKEAQTNSNSFRGILEEAAAEIERLRKVNSDMGWRLNPDRMGGPFTEDEKNWDGWR